MKRTPSKMPPGSAWISKDVMKDANLSGNDIKVYLGLCSYANADTDETFVSQSTLCEEFNLSKKTVINSIQKLESLGYISSKARGRKTSRGRTTNVYTILNNKSDDLSVDFTLKSNEADDQSVNLTHKSQVQSVNLTLKSNSLTTDTTVANGENSASNKNNLNINKNNLNTSDKPSNMSKQATLFDLPSEPKITPQMILSALKDGSKDKSLRLADFIIEGSLDGSTLTELDLCYYYQHLHKEIVGYHVSVNKTVNQGRSGKSSLMYMEEFRDRYNLSPRQAFDLFPKILVEFKRMLEAEGKKKADWYLHIGHLTWTGNCYIEKIMSKVKPKVNEKYLQPEKKDPELTGDPYRVVDEVF